MSESQKVHIGAVKKSFTEPASMLGTAAAVLGLFILIVTYILQTIETLQINRDIAMIVMGNAALVLAVGIIAIIYSYRASMEAAYLDDGHCRIVDQSVKCQGGCNRCPFAAQYLQQIAARQVRPAAPEQIMPERAEAEARPVPAAAPAETAASDLSRPFAAQSSPVSEYAMRDDPMLPLHDRIVRLLQTSDRGLTIEEIAAALGQAPDMIEPQMIAMTVRRDALRDGARYRSGVSSGKD